MGQSGSRNAAHAVWLDVVASVLALALAGSSAFWAWRMYERREVLLARVAPLPTATPAPDPAGFQREARRLVDVSNHVGVGIAFRQANRREIAIQEFMIALALDPTSFEARQNLKEMGVAYPSGVPVAGEGAKE